MLKDWNGDARSIWATNPGEKLSDYQSKKEIARAIIQNYYFDDYEMSWDELARASAWLEKIAKRYGLTTELKNEGLI